MKIDLTHTPTAQRLVKAEREIIRQTLEDNLYNQSKTALDLGISRGALRMKMQQAWGRMYFKNNTNKNK